MHDTAEGARLAQLYEVLRLRLLDLSKRNRLLNYSLSTRSKRFLQIVDDSLDGVHQRLAGDEVTLRIAALPEPEDIPSEERTDEFRSALERARATDVDYLTSLEALEATGGDDEAAMEKLERHLRDRLREELGLPPRPSRKDINRVDHARTLGIDPNLELDPSRTIGADRFLQTLKFPDELEALAEKISSDARLAEQEMGLSTLFLAFGFLEWYDSDISDKKAYAPLLLLPVQIDKQKVRGKPVYSLTVREGKAEANLSLRMLLEQKFSRTLPEFDTEDDADDGDNLGSIEAYIDQVKMTIDGLKRWQVRRWLVLGHFSFGRFAMYSDLESQKWGEPAVYPLVGALLRGSEQKDNGDTLPSVPDDYPIDDPAIEEIAPFLIQDADASQHSALVDVMRGANLVIQGPPGTGKSQTITNIIANALGAGKRVLFLAEKQAALEVVKRRLDRARLGDFCLELHSDKVSPKTVIASLAARYELGIGLDLPAATQRVDPSWFQNREEITSYVRALHTSDADGTTAFGLIWQSLRGRTVHADIFGTFDGVSIPKDLLRDPRRLHECTGNVEIFASMAQTFATSFGHPGRSPWSQVNFADFPTYDAPRFLRTLLDLRRPSQSMLEAHTRHEKLGIANADDFALLVDIDSNLPTVPEVGLIDALVNLDLEDFEKALGVQSELLRIEADLETMPNLRYEECNRLAVATALMHATVGAELADQMPAAAYSFAGGESTILERIADAAESVFPALDVLMLASATPASQLPAVASAVEILNTASEDNRRWIVELPDATEASVIEAMSRWRPLIEAEKAWTAKLQGYRADARPTPRDLDAAAATFRKGGISKAFAALTGSIRAARKLSEGIGVDASPDQIDAFATHLRAVLAFEADRDLCSLFGPAWRGLSTPMEEVLDGVRLRDHLKETVMPLAGGGSVVERAMALSADGITLLSPSCYACKHLLGLAPEVKARFDDTPIAKLISDARRRVTALHEFLSLDRDHLLAGFNSPIRRIAQAHNLLDRAERVRSTLATRATAAQVKALGSSEGRISAMTQAIAWIRFIRASDIKEEVKTLLLSHQANEVRENIGQLVREWAAIEVDCEATRTALEEFGAEAIAVMPPSELLPLIDDLSTRDQELSEFVALRQLRHHLEAAGLAEFLTACDRHAVEPGRIPDLFTAVVAERRAGLARRVVALASNNGASLEARRRAFAERDIAKIKADRVTVRARLLKANPPVGSQYGPRKLWTGMKLLANEFPKVKRFTPVRQILARAGSATQALKPCFMMSPLSLAKFVAARSLEFDLLVIDEASQMRPEDALGGMLRAKQIVVVGDAKQLPPTDFFARAESQGNDAGASDDEDDIDAESILEACESTFGERRRLKWHYRSRCESLIAFSNRSFYDNTLITFPMAKPGSFSVNLVRVDGTYRASRNPAEAARVAEEAVAFMRHFALAPEDELPTLGIVAVNVEQREFIEEEIRRLWADDELVEIYKEKAKAKGEPFFVKNLENVQGDERDHIFISMTYGRKHGEPAVAQYFGPINRKQGHRRLNVLLTRARVRVGLFTSFGSVDVRPTESSSEGVHALKSYLEYAETQGTASVQGIGGEPDSDFEVEVAHRLRLKGYIVDMQVGVSGFRIDLGVRHPDHPERFLAGVECDGAAYHSSKSARDRDRLREEVLNNLGWNLVRVWSTDWFDNPGLETDKLARKLEELRRRPAPRFESYPPFFNAGATAAVDEVQVSGVRSDIVDCDREDVTSSHAGAPATDSSSAGSTNESTALALPPAVPTGSELLAGDGLLTPQEAGTALEAFREEVIRTSMPDWDAQRSILRPAMIETFVQQQITDPADWYNRIPQYLRTGTNPAEKTRFLEDICEIVERISTASTPRLGNGTRVGNGHVASSGPVTYKFADPAGIGHPDRNRFFDPTYTAMLKAMIAHVIEIEGPVFEDIVVDRIARAHGLRRSGNQIRHRVVGLLPSNVTRADEGDRKVIWPFSKKSGAMYPFRKDPTDGRGHEDVPVEELAAIAAPFVRLRMDDAAILHKMAEEFELDRLREATRARFAAALLIARQSMIRS